MDLESLYSQRFTRLITEVQNLRSSLVHLTDTGNKNHKSLIENLAPREIAELNLTVAVSIISLYKAHLRCQGTDDSKHAIMQECERLEAYLPKLSQALYPPPVDT